MAVDDEHVSTREVDDLPRMQVLPFGVWTKLAHWDGFARSWVPRSTIVELKPDGSLLFHGPVELRRELAPGIDTVWPEVDRVANEVLADSPRFKQEYEGQWTPPSGPGEERT
jgi:hypothetical protein